MGLTFDTGALIGLERARHSMRKVYDVAITSGIPITIPSVVVAEWWRRGVKEKERTELLRSMIVETVTDRTARLAGAALTRVSGVQTIDAIVVASASTRPGEIIYTSDPDDLSLLCEMVPEFSRVRIERA
jgi:predicted nucleic acid-binding protein